jgi:DNA polymerase elongation subunit (family B)
MLEHIDLSAILFLDIETVSQKKQVEDLSPAMQELWDMKAQSIQRNKPSEEQVSAAELYPSAAIYAEFGKIICISVGYLTKDKESKMYKLRLKSYYDHDEKKLLEEFSKVLNMRDRENKLHFNYVCGHNIKEFDVPYICRRMVVHKLPLPPAIDVVGKKPWETNFLDTMELWKFGDFKSFTSLKLLCGVFGIPTPKDDIDGSEVYRVYWEENDLERIERYCKKDVLATAQVFLSYRYEPLLTEDQIQYV